MLALSFLVLFIVLPLSILQLGLPGAEAMDTGPRYVEDAIFGENQMKDAVDVQPFHVVRCFAEIARLNAGGGNGTR